MVASSRSNFMQGLVDVRRTAYVARRFINSDQDRRLG